jgi:hypothetical protein
MATGSLSLLFCVFTGGHVFTKVDPHDSNRAHVILFSACLMEPSSAEHSALLWLKENAMKNMLQYLNSPDHCKSEYKYIPLEIEFPTLLNENCMFLLVYVALNALVQFGNWY